MTKNKDGTKKPHVLLYRDPWKLGALQAKLDLFFDGLISGLIRILGARMDEMKLDLISSNVEELDSHFLISFAIPGIIVDSIRVELDGDFLDISCKRWLHTNPSVKPNPDEPTMEDVERLIRLPTGIAISKIEAEFKEDTLLLSIPKRDNGIGSEIRVKVVEPAITDARMTSLKPDTSVANLAG